MNNSRDIAALAPVVSVNQTLVSRLTDVLAWIVSLWLILMTGWYAITAVRALEHPLNVGEDLAWARLCAGIAVAVVLSHLLVRRRLMTLIWLGVIIAIAIAMIAMSHQAIAVLITAWLFLLSLVWGDWMLRRMLVVGNPLSLDRVAIAVPLGLALLALLALALCLLQRLTSKWAWLVFSVLTLIQYRSVVKIIRASAASLRSRGYDSAKQSLPEFGIIVVLLGFVFLLDFSWALAPEIHSDALAAHLPLAKYYVEHPVALVSYSPFIANLVDLLFSIALSLHGQVVAKLLMLAATVISTVATFVLGRTLFSARVGLWAAALFFSTPLVSWLSTTAFIDAAVTMYLASTTLVFFQWRESRQNGLLWAAGLLTGAAIAAKLNALLGLPVIGLVLLWDLFRSHQPVRERVKGFTGYILGVCLVAGPGFALCYVLSGNPFYPLPVLSKLFKRSAGPAATLIANSNDFGIGSSPAALVKLPFAFTFASHQFGEALPSGALGLALVLAPLALITALAGGAAARRAAILLGVCVVYVSCLAFMMQYGRYYIPALPIVAVLAAEPVIHLSKIKWLRRVNLMSLGAVIATQIVLTPLMYWNIPERFPLKVVFGLEGRASFLSRALPFYDPVQFLNQRVEPGQKVLAVGGDSGRAYLNAPMTGWFDAEVENITARSPPAKLAANLINSGFTYLLVDHESRRFHFQNPPYSSEPFLSQFATLEYAANHVTIYRLRDVALEPHAAANLVSNPGFEFLSETGYPSGWFPTGHPLITQGGSAHGGKIAVRADADDWLYTHAPIEPDKIYSLGYWCRTDKPDQFARLQINWIDPNGQIVGASIEVVPAGLQWTWQHFSAMSPHSASQADIYVSVHENSEVWFDDYMFVPGEIQAKP